MKNYFTHRIKSVYLLFEAILPVLIGGLIYILLRTDSLLMYKWFQRTNISGSIYLIRDLTNFVNFGYYKTIINTLPGGLWTFSYTAFLLIIWRNKINFGNIYYFIFIPLIAILSEFLQLFGMVSGTFDILDILTYAIGAILPLFIHYHKIKINLR